MTTPFISHSQPRDDVRVTLPDRSVLSGPIGTTIGAFFAAAFPAAPQADPIIAAIHNNQLRELTYSVRHDATIEPVLLSTSDGGRIYRRSLVMLLTTAADEMWPGCRISVRYSVADGGFYCTRLGTTPFTPQELEQLEAHMRQIVDADAPIVKRVVPLDEAIDLFESRQEQDKLRLLEQRTRDHLTLYTLRGRDDYYYGYMVASTGLLRYFRLIWVRDGFILQYPRQEDPSRLKPIRAYDKLSRVFRQADDWLQMLGVEDMGHLNRIIRDGRHIQELILVAEALHEQHVAEIAQEIVQRYHEGGVRLALIAGPSSSGKTTFAKRLAIQLITNGLRPLMLELDNYFVDRDLTPRDEKGEYDFEALGAVNVKLFNEHLVRLSAGEDVNLPRFDFMAGKSVAGRTVRLEANQIVLVEGIHGLNPHLVSDVPRNLIFRVYVSALTQLNIDNHNRIPTTDVRLLRRIVRDTRTRGHDAASTLGRWASVRRGEKINIFPYQENADAMFNSALVYEVAALRPLVEPLLLQVPLGTPAHIEAKRLLSFLGWVRPLPTEYQRLIPDTSLLREFVGDSILDDYNPYRPADDLRDL